MATACFLVALLVVCGSVLAMQARNNRFQRDIMTEFQAMYKAVHGRKYQGRWKL